MKNCLDIGVHYASALFQPFKDGRHDLIDPGESFSIGRQLFFCLDKGGAVQFMAAVVNEGLGRFRCGFQMELEPGNPVIDDKPLVGAGRA